MRIRRERLGIGWMAAAAWMLSGCAGGGGSGYALERGEPERAPAVIDHAEWRDGLADRLRADVSVLAVRFPGRHAADRRVLDDAASWIEGRIGGMGLAPVSEWYTARVGSTGFRARNIFAEVRGTTEPERIIVIGAHYDSEPGTPGADDNASGVAVVLAMAEWFAARPQPVTLRFVLFTNEELPFFHGPSMGSLVRARSAKERGDDVVAMLCMEMMGYFTDDPVSEEVAELARTLGIEPPAREDFVAIASWPVSEGLVGRVSAAWSGPVVGVPVVGTVWTPGLSASDHWSYWQAAYPAVMVTDTSFLRNPHYHQPTDTVATLDFARMAAVTESVRGVAESLAADPPELAVIVDEVEIVNDGSTALGVSHVRAGQPDARLSVSAGDRVCIRAPRVTPVRVGGSVVRVMQVREDGTVDYQVNGPNGRVFHTMPAGGAVTVDGAAMRVVGGP